MTEPNIQDILDLLEKEDILEILKAKRNKVANAITALQRVQDTIDVQIEKLSGEPTSTTPKQADASADTQQATEQTPLTKFQKFNKVAMGILRSPEVDLWTDKDLRQAMGLGMKRINENSKGIGLFLKNLERDPSIQKTKKGWKLR